MRVQSEENDFRTIGQEEMATKMAKFGNFEKLVRYPIWVSIKSTLAGKLAPAGRNLMYFLRFQENVQKPPKITD